MKAIFSILVLCGLLACNSDDMAKAEEEACAGIIDFLPSTSFRIALVNENGDNLIENNFYQKELLELQLNGASWNDGIRIQDNILILYPTGIAGDNQYLIHLSESDTDTLDFNFSTIEVKSRANGLLLCGEKAELNFASYNQIEADISSSSPNSISSIPITVVKRGN